MLHLSHHWYQLKALPSKAITVACIFSSSVTSFNKNYVSLQFSTSVRPPLVYSPRNWAFSHEIGHNWPQFQQSGPHAFWRVLISSRSCSQSFAVRAILLVFIRNLQISWFFRVLDRCSDTSDNIRCWQERPTIEIAGKVGAILITFYEIKVVTLSRNGHSTTLDCTAQRLELVNVTNSID
ncbi:uncharacterized protein LOC130729225 isoform X2 [Lotus japonicus]|uniref:uncharacterized protein LOC130729225 isoform X2 n=1 Tax=Lotus japonicus TaxID=34305 RepID=UPI00258EEDDA|nr:uncharacterized protein LOC130729225 isoform X2 [Lotus japonicus]